MGITGLLPFLEKATKPCHISEFRGATAVIDTYCWLHRGATTCAIQLVQGEETDLYVNYCIRYIKMLQSFDIRPILVFDGNNLPAKSGTEAKRRESRRKAKQKAAELLYLGKTDEARSYLKASVNITPEMASALIKECHKVNVDCIVAPYECDAQLAFFSLTGIAELVITEDSDLVLFGCPKIFYKLDIRGCGYLVESEKIPIAMNVRPDKFTIDKFRHMCILSGCDYVDSLQGIGLKKAQKFITLTEETNPEKFLDKIPKYLNMNKIVITEEYKKKFMIADATFKHQIVFDPFKKKLVPLIDPEVTGTDPKYCVNAGEIYDHKTAYQVALGNLHPSKSKKLDDWDPKKANLTSRNIWYDGLYQRSVSRKEQKQKESFRDYFNKIKLEPFNEVDDNQLRMEEDAKIKKELEFYSKPVPIQDVVKNSPEKTINKHNEVISPVLTKNPFARRISKFQRTETETGIVVKSRYFSSSNIVVQDTSLGEEDNAKDEDFVVKENVAENYVIEEISSDTNPSPDKKLPALEIVESKTEIHALSDVSPLLTKYSAVKNSDSVKRKLPLGPCRSLGLKKVKIQGQQKISNFFEKFKKPP